MWPRIPKNIGASFHEGVGGRSVGPLTRHIAHSGRPEVVPSSVELRWRSAASVRLRSRSHLALSVHQFQSPQTLLPGASFTVSGRLSLLNHVYSHRHLLTSAAAVECVAEAPFPGAIPPAFEGAVHAPQGDRSLASEALEEQYEPLRREWG